MIYPLDGYGPPLADQRLAMNQSWKRLSIFLLLLLAVPLCLIGVVMVGRRQNPPLLSLGQHSSFTTTLLASVAVLLVVEAVVAYWQRLPETTRRRARTIWRWRTRWLLRSRTLSLWPVALVLLTSLLGIADWFPSRGWSRPMMLALVATVGIYGYFREKADQNRALVAFADVARCCFAEEAERIIEASQRIAEERKRDDLSRDRANRERDRNVEKRNRSFEKAEQSARLARIKRFFKGS